MKQICKLDDESANLAELADWSTESQQTRQFRKLVRANIYTQYRSKHHATECYVSAARCATSVSASFAAVQLAAERRHLQRPFHARHVQRRVGVQPAAELQHVQGHGHELDVWGWLRDKASAFNQPLSFDTSSVTTMYQMSNYASAFNQPLSFDTSKVKDMRLMFLGASFLSAVNRLSIRCAWQGQPMREHVRLWPCWLLLNRLGFGRHDELPFTAAARAVATLLPGPKRPFGGQSGCDRPVRRWHQLLRPQWLPGLPTD